jgi:predicted MFS family arabinose efflux permease
MRRGNASESGTQLGMPHRPSNRRSAMPASGGYGDSDRGSDNPSVNQPADDAQIAETAADAEANAAGPGDESNDRGATYRDVLASIEFRYILGSTILSLIGDQMAKVALSILVFERTSSALLTALTYGISYLPWVIGGPLLSTVADRLPRRRVMIVCDLVRAFMIALIAAPYIPVPALIVILLVSSMFSPPFESSRSALSTQVLTGDRYVLGNGLSLTASQACNILGLLAGGALVAAVSARGALLIDAGTFVLSAVLIRIGVMNRPVAAGAARTSWLKQMVGGAGAVFKNRRLRAILLVVWCSPAFGFAWEGITAPWASDMGRGARTVGVLLAAGTAGMVAGTIVITRLCPPRLRNRLVLPMAIAAPGVIALVLVARTNFPLAVALVVLGGMLSSFTIPLNAMFMQTLPVDLRGRAFGFAQGGLMASQGVGVLIAGALAGVLRPGTVIGILGIAGAVLTLAIGWRRPIHAAE